MAKVTLASLVPQVAALLDTTVDTTSTPSTSQVTAWLVEGKKKLVNMLPDNMLNELAAVYTDTSGVGHFSMNSAGAPPLKILNVRVNWVQAKQIDFREYQWIGKKAPSRYTVGDYCWCLAWSYNDVRVMVLPRDGSDITVDYIKDDDAADLPSSWAGLAVDYAVICGKIQDEEPEQAQVLYQRWMNDVQIAAGGKPINTEGMM